MDGSFDSSQRSVQWLRMLMQGLEALHGPWRIFTKHVKGHSGHPYNELVNTLAQSTLIRDFCEPPPLDLRPLTAGDAYPLRWLWLRMRLQQGSLDLPKVHNSCLDIPHRACQLATQPDLPWTFGYGSQPALIQEAHLDLNLHFLTFNVRTLNDPVTKKAPPDAFLNGRMKYLEEQFVALGATIVGLQETRTRRTETATTQDYYKFKSAASNGHGGIELWCNRNRPLAYSDGVPVFCKPEASVVIKAEAELLIVDIKLHSLLRMVIFVGHAPHKGHDDMTKSNWWTAFGQALHAVPGNRKLIGLLDANAATGTITSAGIGNYAVEEEDTNGQLLRALLDANSLWLPNTFPCCHTGPAVTWISSAAALPQGSRLDYVVLPLEWLGAEVSSMTVPDIDAGQAGLDHFALSVRVSWALTSTRKARRPRTTPSRIDWAAVRKCRDPEVWRAIFTDLPQPAWNVDVHTHWHQLHSADFEIFPSPQKPASTALYRCCYMGALQPKASYSPTICLSSPPLFTIVACGTLSGASTSTTSSSCTCSGFDMGHAVCVSATS